MPSSQRRLGRRRGDPQVTGAEWRRAAEADDEYPLAMWKRKLTQFSNDGLLVTRLRSKLLCAASSECGQLTTRAWRCIRFDAHGFLICTSESFKVSESC
jgi:hypothetical protein